MNTVTSTKGSLYFAYFLVALIGLFAGGMIVWYTLRSEVQEVMQEAKQVQKAESLFSFQATPKTSRTSTNMDEASSAQANIDTSRRNALVVAADKVGPAVVSVNVIQTEIVRRRSPFDDIWGDFFFPRTFKRDVQSLGSGFIINDGGYILTNGHNVENATDISVTLVDGRKFPAKLIWADMTTDLALLKVDATNLPVVTLGDSDDLLIGEWAIAIGNPFGSLLDDPQPTVTVGVISATNRDLVPQEGESKIHANMIQTDASINPGNSGGPLVNSKGEVIGVNTFIFTTSGGSLGIGFAIPINRAKRIVEEFLARGRILKPWLGVQTQDLNEQLRRSFELENEDIYGVIVSSVQPNSPAEKSGIRTGDIILKLNDKPVRSSYDWEGEKLDTQVGQTLKLTIQRDSQRIIKSLIVASLPSDVAQRVESDLGLILTDLTPAIRGELDIKHEKGAVILEVTDPDLSRRGGIQPYDVLLQINKTEVNSAKQAKQLLDNLPRRSRNFLILERNGQSIPMSLIIS